MKNWRNLNHIMSMLSPFSQHLYANSAMRDSLSVNGFIRFSPVGSALRPKSLLESLQENKHNRGMLRRLLGRKNCNIELR
jgi:hypothetical protein